MNLKVFRRASYLSIGISSRAKNELKNKVMDENWEWIEIVPEIGQFFEQNPGGTKKALIPYP